MLKASTIFTKQNENLRINGRMGKGEKIHTTTENA